MDATDISRWVNDTQRAIASSHPLSINLDLPNLAVQIEEEFDKISIDLAQFLGHGFFSFTHAIAVEESGPRRSNSQHLSVIGQEGERGERIGMGQQRGDREQPYGHQRTSFCHRIRRDIGRELTCRCFMLVVFVMDGEPLDLDVLNTYLMDHVIEQNSAFDTSLREVRDLHKKFAAHSKKRSTNSKPDTPTKKSKLP